MYPLAPYNNLRLETISVVVDKGLHTDAQKNTTQGQLHNTHIRERALDPTDLCM